MSTGRVLHIKGTLDTDGATVVEYGLAQELRQEIVFDWLTDTEPEKIWRERFAETGSQFYRAEYSKNGNTVSRIYRKYRAYRVFFRNHPYDAVHIDTDGFHRTMELLAAKRAGIPRRVLHSHNTKSESKGRLGGSHCSRFLGQWLYTHLATDCIACSHAAGAWLFGENRRKPVLVLKNGMDTERYRFDPEKRKLVRNRLGLEKEILMGHVGRFENQKNHRFLLSVFKTLYERNRDYRLILIGDGSLRKEIEELVRRENLDQAVIISGNVSCVESYYQAMDAFLLPSLHEGLGIAAVEAQCSGLPCLLSDAVPGEAKILDTCRFLPINRGTEIWAAETEKLLQISRPREDGSRKVCDAGYDIRDSAAMLLAVYRGERT